MPNFGSNFCLRHAIHEEQKRRQWYEKDDQHCWHTGNKTSVCCWCGEKRDHPDKEHGTYDVQVK